MSRSDIVTSRAVLIWGALCVALLGPLIAAAWSPLLQWRGAVYILAGFAGILGMCLVVLQPLLAMGWLPGLGGLRGRHVHRWVGLALILAIVVHVAGLWVTSPPDVIDVLLFRSPTPFSIWGVLAMWAVFLAAGVAALRGRFRPLVWRRLHLGLAVVIVGGSVAHALLIEGTMEFFSKLMLCGLAVAVVLRMLVVRWALLVHRHGGLRTR